jgi:hypothetical protein
MQCNAVQSESSMGEKGSGCARHVAPECRHVTTGSHAPHRTVPHSLLHLNTQHIRFGRRATAAPEKYTILYCKRVEPVEPMINHQCNRNINNTRSVNENEILDAHHIHGSSIVLYVSYRISRRDGWVGGLFVC